MSSRMLLCVLSLASLVSVGTSQESPPKIAPKLKIGGPREDSLATRLTGNWAIDAELTKRLGGDAGVQRIEFAETGRMPAGLEGEAFAELRDKRIRGAGVVRDGRQEHPYLLVTAADGTTTIVAYTLDARQNPSDWKSIQMVLVEGSRTENDLLFLGSQRGNPPYAVLQRAAHHRRMGAEESTEKVAGPTDLPSTFATMKRLLSARKHLEFFETFMTPEDRKRFSSGKAGKTLEDLAEEFGKGKSDELLGLIEKIERTKPELDAEGTTAKFANPDGGRGLVLVRIDGTWRIKN